MPGEAEFLPQAGDGKIRFLVLSSGRGGVDDAGSGIYGFLPEHEFWDIICSTTSLVSLELNASLALTGDLLVRAGKSA